MPVLEQFNLPSSPVQEFLISVSAQLVSVVDQSQPPKQVNMSVKLGLDTVLESAINGTPSSDEMPCIRIFYDPHTVSYNNTQNTVLFQNIPISLYFLYALDYPSTNFQQLREDHIRLNLDYLKYNVYSDGIGMTPTTWWKWNNPEQITITHNTDIKYLGRYMPITPESNFSCSRVDLMALVKNYKSTNDRTL